MIAADLTLYSNPLNSALHVKDKKGGKSGSKEVTTSSQKDSTTSSTSDTIAADMTKYDSPMADYDKRRRDKADREAAEEKDAKKEDKK